MEAVEQEELLFCGYTRSISQYVIPGVIIRLCLFYFSQIYRWQIQGDEFINLLSNGYNKNHPLSSATFTIEGIQFQATMYLVYDYWDKNLMVQIKLIYEPPSNH